MKAGGYVVVEHQGNPGALEGHPQYFSHAGVPIAVLDGSRHWEYWRSHPQDDLMRSGVKHVAILREGGDALLEDGWNLYDVDDDGNLIEVG